MYFQIRYFRNPIDRAWPRQTEQGEHLLNQGLRCIKRKIMKPKLNINPTRNAKRAVHGLAYLFGFKYRCFLKDNFTQKRKYLYSNYNGERCELSNWALIISELDIKLRAIQSYSNVNSLLRSKYAKHIQISNINRYYHPRKKHFAKHARIILAKLGNNRRYKFVGTFQRFGSKHNGQLTILLTDISFKGHQITDHLWFNAGKRFKSLGHLNPNDRIAFTARVNSYRKGYLPDKFIKKYDYQLSYPSHIKKLK